MRGRVAALSFALAGLLALAAAPLASARFAYVTGVNPGDESPPVPFVVPVNLATGTAGAEISLPNGGEGAEPPRVAITPDGKTAYVTNDSNTDQVIPIDLATNTAGTPIDVGADPFGIAITPDGKTAYVTQRFSGTASAIDLATKAVTTIPGLGSGSADIAITPDGKLAYVANEFDGTISVIDLATNTVVKTFTGLNSPFGVAVTPDGKSAYVSENGGDTLPIDVATNALGSPIVGGAGEAIAVTPDGKHAYTADTFGNASVPLDLAAGSTGTPIPVPGFPGDVAITPDGSHAYLPTQSNTDVLTPVDLATNTALTGFPVGNRPEGIAIVPNQGPHAAFSSSPHKPKVKKSVAFDGGGSTDSDGSVARYDWDFGDGKSATNAGATPHHSYAKAGTYKVTLTTTDNEGCSTTIVFTGQTAYCNGSSAARVTHSVTVAKEAHKPRCPTVSAGSSSFVPRFRPGPTVPGVRVRLFTSTPSRLGIGATLVWFKHSGHRRGAHLRSLSVTVRHWRRVRFPIPDSLLGRFPVGSKVRVRLRIEAHPLGAPSSCGNVTHRTLHLHVVKVFPNAVQHGRAQL